MAITVKMILAVCERSHRGELDAAKAAMDAHSAAFVAMVQDAASGVSPETIDAHANALAAHHAKTLELQEAFSVIYQMELERVTQRALFFVWVNHLVAMFCLKSKWGIGLPMRLWRYLVIWYTRPFL